MSGGTGARPAVRPTRDDAQQPARVSLRGGTAEDAPTTVIASLYRHPRSEDRWRLSRVDDAVHCGRHLVEGRITRADVLRLVNDSHWLLEWDGTPSFPTERWELLGRGLLTAAWRDGLR